MQLLLWQWKWTCKLYQSFNWSQLHPSTSILSTVYIRSSSTCISTPAYCLQYILGALALASVECIIMMRRASHIKLELPRSADWYWESFPTALALGVLVFLAWSTAPRSFSWRILLLNTCTILCATVLRPNAQVGELLAMATKEKERIYCHMIFCLQNCDAWPTSSGKSGVCNRYSMRRVFYEI